MMAPGTRAAASRSPPRLRPTGWAARAIGVLCILTLAVVALNPATLFAQETADDRPVIRGAVLKIGTVNWELTTIKNRALDRENNFQLTILPFADNGATRVALAAGEADFAVADWIWVAAQNAAGKDYVFLPYSKAVGGILVSADSTVASLGDLAGKKIGIAGGPVDKSWLILRAYAQREYGIDLAAVTEQVYGAPPLIMKAGLSGDTDASINFWHFAAKMKAAGMKEILSVNAAATALGLNPETPLLGYVFHRSFVEANPDSIKGFAASSRAAKTLLATDDAAFVAIRGLMRASSDAQFTALVTGWREGIPRPGPVEESDARAMLQLMADLGGKKLVGDAEDLPKGLFLPLP